MGSYQGFYKLYANFIKKNDPEALVVAASPSLRLTAAFDRFYPEYLTELAALGWPVDVIAIHTYPDGTGDPIARGLLIQKAKDALAAAGAPELPLWDTELNYGLAGPGDIPKQEITGAQAAGFVVRAGSKAVSEDKMAPSTMPTCGRCETNSFAIRCLSRMATAFASFRTTSSPPRRWQPA